MRTGRYILLVALFVYISFNMQILYIEHRVARKFSTQNTYYAPVYFSITLICIQLDQYTTPEVGIYKTTTKKKENTLLTKKATKKRITKKYFFLGRFFGRERVFFLYFYRYRFILFFLIASWSRACFLSFFFFFLERVFLFSYYLDFFL